MGSIDFEGKRVPIEEGDSVASALFRSGVRTFTRSVKHHRRRGLYCLSGDCPNCLVTVDGEPGCRACMTDARGGQVVKRESGWPSIELDALAVTDRLHTVMPVGFYYKTFIRPRFAWGIAERVIRSSTGVGELPDGRTRTRARLRHAQPDVLVVGAGVAGLAAALEAANQGLTVILCDEGIVGQRVPPGPTRERIYSLQTEVLGSSDITLLERHVAIGIYADRLVAVAGPDELLRVDPGRVIVATGAVETHSVFSGNDLPGVWLGRGAARMAGVHAVKPGERAVVVASTADGASTIGALRDAEVEVVAALVTEELEELVPGDVETIVGGAVQSAQGRKHVEAVVVSTPAGSRRIECDILAVSLGFEPRDGLLRMAEESSVTGAGEVVLPGCSLQEAEASGVDAVNSTGSAATAGDALPPAQAGYVCLCEDVGVSDLEQAWEEGWTSTEILKRYTTATMGPCQGALCGRRLSAFVGGKSATAADSGRTTARPLARPVRLEDLAAGVVEVIEKRTSLHDIHVSAGARMDWSGGWKRPYSYGDTAAEYSAVRERVSIMDVSTLGKFLIAGRDARRLVDGVFPCSIEDLDPGRSRYLLALDEAGYVMDDGLVCALGDGGYYLTSTSGGADRMETWLRYWADRWDLHVHIVNQTAMLGAINVAGPQSRELIALLSRDALDAKNLPYPGHAVITVSGVACRALRVGFVGELSFELHHARSQSPALWRALMSAGSDLGIAPHGLDALDVLRLEKGHLYVGQDTMPDDHPMKLGLGWAVSMDKPSFVGRTALQRMAELPAERKLVGLTFDTKALRGAPLYDGAAICGRVTSAAFSPALGHHIGLGWIRSREGVFPEKLKAVDAGASVVATPFLDPAGERLRA